MAIVAKVYRGSIVDLTHIAHVAVVNHAGELLHSVGDPKRVTFIRSSAKMVQALASLESGAVDAYGLSEQELALLCASHNGEEIHTSTAANILQKAGLGIQHLQCGIHPSFNSFVAKELEEKGVTLNASHNNCSGKHSGMLIAANYKKEDLSNYLSINHPVQQRILQTLSEVCAYPKEQIVIATDGCGVPVHALPLEKYAHGMAKFAKPEVFEPQRALHVRRLVHAMMRYPYMVAGRDRLCSDLMSVCKGKVFAKLGADGYYTVGLTSQGIALTCKCEDGKMPIAEALAVHVLYKLGYITKTEFNALERYHKLQVFNHRGELVGHTEFDFEI